MAITTVSLGGVANRARQAAGTRARRASRWAGSAVGRFADTARQALTEAAPRRGVVTCGHCPKPHPVPWDEFDQHVMVEAAERIRREAAARHPEQQPPTATAARPAAQAPAAGSASATQKKPRNTTKKAPRPSAPPAKERTVSDSNATRPTTAPEAIVAAVRNWAQSAPPSIPAARADANMMAAVWIQVADAFRDRIRLEMDQNGIPERLLAPLHAAAQALSGLGGAHQEYVRLIDLEYGAAAAVVADPSSPNSGYFAGGR